MNKWIVCFDLFGTLIAAPPGTLTYEDLFERIGCHKEFVSAYVRRHFMAGPARELSYLEMAKELCHATGISPSQLEPEEVACVWGAENRALEWFPNMKNVITDSSRDGHSRLVLVTNITHAALAEPLVREVIDVFDDAYLSCRELCTKPDPYVWQTIMRRHPSAERYCMYGDSELSDLVIPAKMGWIVSDPRNWIDPGDVCHQEYTDEDGNLREAVS